MPLHQRDFKGEISIKVYMATNDLITEIEPKHWTKGEIVVAPQSWLWIQVELIV